MVPDWWEFLLLALAVYRVWRLLALDSLLDRPRGWFVGAEDSLMADWLGCPFCSGAWLSVLAWLCWLLSPHWTIVLAVPAALSAVVALIGSRLDPA